jgi:hypothetical protein
MPTNIEKISRDKKVMESASFAIEPFLRKEDIINLSNIKTIPAQTIPAKKYKYGLSTKVEIA